MTIVLLLAIAITAIIGTVIPQNDNPGLYIKVYGEFLYRFFVILDITDMYHSWWFQLFLFLLTMNIVICSVERFPTAWKTAFKKKRVFNPERFRTVSNRVEITDSRTPDQLKPLYEKAAGKGFGFLRTDNQANGFLIFAEKWRWTRLGVYVVHASVILLLIGSMIGNYFGFDGFVNIPEGETVDTIQLRNSNQRLKLGFEIRCDDFHVAFYPDGTPKEFRSKVTIFENGQAVHQKDIIMNDPLRYKGINVFQSSYGELPNERPGRTETADWNPGDEITLDFTHPDTGKRNRITTMMGKQVTLPHDAGRFKISKFQKTADFMGRNIGSAFTGILTFPDNREVTVLLPLSFPNFDKMRNGKWVISVANQKVKKFNPMEKEEKKYYTGLQVTKDPGVWLVYTGFILIIIGCYVTFFMSHQKLCIEMVREGDGTRIFISGTTNKNKISMENKVKMFSSMLQKL